MANPVLTWFDRNGEPESAHRGAFALVAPAGDGGATTVVASMGDPQQPIFARSAMKGLQALAIVESGAADAFGLGDAELAVAAASHSGEPVHLRTVAGMLAKAGLDETALQCGSTATFHSQPNGPKRPIHHNCSGKHAGMLLTAVHLGVDPARYLDPGAANQRLVRDAVASMTGTDLFTAVDGCSAPTFRMPLSGLAAGILRLANPDRLGNDRAAACRRITTAVATHPTLIGGAVGRSDSDLIAATGGRIFAKLGAEGVFACGVVGEDRALVVAVDDGNQRGFDAVALHTLHHHGLLNDTEMAALDRWSGLDIRNAAGVLTGRQHIAVGGRSNFPGFGSAR